MAAATAPVSSKTPLSAEALFDGVGPDYEKMFSGLQPQLASIQWLVEQLAEKKPAKILDIGCGTGRPVCAQLADAGHDVLGIDISSAMIADAKTKVPNARFEKIGIEHFKTADQTFDAITVYFSLIADQTQASIREAFSKVYKWLKLGGLFVFATVPVACESEKIEWLSRSIVVSGLPSKEILESMTSAGFTIEQHAESNFLPTFVEGVCKPDDIWEEPHVFVYARKK